MSIPISYKQIQVKQNMLEGKGVPMITYSDTTYFKLPEPMGENREDLRMYDFEESNLDEYRSEGNVSIKVGQKFVFVANLKWLRTNKLVLKALMKAWVDEYIYFTLNDDKTDIKFKCKVSKPRYRFTKGLYGIGYDISVTMRGIEYLDEPLYGDLVLSGYGMDYGNKPDNQSP